MNQTCGCCTGIEAVVPVSEANPPGLSALAYRAGSYATFFETMIARLGALPQLTTRDPSDPSIAVLDAWAVVADVLTFYQERIANEGYLPTARERRSVLELARLVGYRLRPGVAASVRLAFTVADGFAGSIPAGTRAQSLPGAGEKPQFFETSAPFAARDAWNALAPRLTRTQAITPPFPPPPVALSPDATEIPVTGADVVDTVYAEGIATGLRPGDALFLVFGSGANEQYLRVAEAVDAQAAQQRTEVTLAPDARFESRTLPLFLAKAQYLFPGSDIAAHVTQVLTVLRDNLRRGGSAAIRTALLRAAIPEIALQQELALKRGFTRISAFLGLLRRALTISNANQFAFDDTGAPLASSATALTYIAAPAQQAGSPLARLDAIVEPLSRPASLHPANALRLDRSITQIFAPQSDVAPRLIAALKPAAAETLYQAWTAVATPSSRVQLLAARVKATLFASSFAGAATVIQHEPTVFTAPTIATAWTSLGTLSTPLATLALDAPYEHVAPGSWIAVDRPVVNANNAVQGRTTTFHLVTGARTTGMDTGSGFSAKVSVLTVDPPWLPDLGLSSVDVLRGTVVYAQSEPLALAPEPLDTDVEGDSIDLDDVYAGLEPGRWIIVSGTRTDVPGASGVTASELAMIAGVSQGSQAPQCAVFPFATPPFTGIFYTTPADVNGDRLVVGTIGAGVRATLAQQISQQIADKKPLVPNRRYCDQVQLAPGVFADAYVPSIAEIEGRYPSFEGMLVDPKSNVPFPGGEIPKNLIAAGLFAWRVSNEKLHTILRLASALAYKYDRGTLTIYGNVVDATHGQSTGEVLGNGDAARGFPAFALGQPPLTYLSAPTPSGTSSSVTVRVNELEWHEIDDLGRAGPSQRCYVTHEDDAHKTTVTFGDGVHGARLPTGTANVKATYRYGLGNDGNVAAGHISQLATHPLGVQGVVNPLSASGGADPDTIEQARENVPIAVMALDRLVSVRDYADFARTYAGIGKAVSALLSDGRRQLVVLTVAGSGDIPIDPASDLYRNLVSSLRAFGDPQQPVAVVVRRVRLLVMSAAVGLRPDYAWEDVAPKVRAALLALFAFDARALGQTAYLSEAVRAAQRVEGVDYVDVNVFDGVPENVTAADLARLGTTLRVHPHVQAEPARADAARGILPAELVFMTPEIPDTLILREAGAR
ncbi:MAG: hypothetical protein JWO66_1925 [Candidatus Eremiobacteraeota bacterium]|nr:hypothetical protein [Candidatus Eremiobacteraeota bacterium]